MYLMEQCIICGRKIEDKYFSQKMHPECAYALKKTRVQAKWHAWKGDRRALYFSNMLKFLEATKEGREVSII